MKLHDIFHGDSLKAQDLEGRDVTVTIENWSLREFEEKGRDGEPYQAKKLELHFRGSDRTLICNKTNANTIAEFLGDDVEKWVGHQITLFPTRVDFAGRRVDAIRVKAPTQSLPDRPQLPDPRQEDQQREEHSAYRQDLDIPF